MQARMVNQSLFSGVRGKGAFMWLAVKSIKSQRQRGDLERKEACSILVISKLHRPLLTLLIRSLGKSHSGHNLFFFLFSCLRLRSQPLCKQSLYAAPQNSASSCAFKLLQRKGLRSSPCAGAQGLLLGCCGHLENVCKFCAWRIFYIAPLSMQLGSVGIRGLFLIPVEKSYVYTDFPSLTTN